MPPRRKRGRKNATQTIRKSPKIQTFSDDDEDIFEMPKLRSQVKTEPTSTSSQTKSSCQSKRLLRTVAAKATSNGISDETKKHVDKNCKMASNSAKNNNDIEISDDDIELDLTPKRKLSFGDEHSSQAKRKKPNRIIESSDEEDVDIEKVPPNGLEETNKESLNQPSDAPNADNPNETANSECENEAELEIETATDLEEDIEAVGASQSEESVPEPNQPQAIVQESNSIHSENEEIENGSAGNDQEIDDDFIDMNVDLDFLDEITEDNAKSSPAMRIKKPNMEMPRWKRLEVEKEKQPQSPVQQKQQQQPTQQLQSQFRQNRHVNISKGVTVTICGASAKASQPPPLPVSRPMNEPVGQQLLFNNPERLTITKSNNTTIPESVNRDPRMAKTVAQNVAGPAISAPSTEKNADPLQKSGNNPPRLSVKDRLGNRVGGKPFTHQKTGFIINNNTAGPMNGAAPKAIEKRATGAFSNLSRNQTGTASQINVQQPHPDLPTFVRKELEQKSLCTFQMPSFATTSQRYDRIFHRIFERTCHLYMHDACAQPHECQLNHQLPDHDYFLSCINKMEKDRVIDLYDEFMCRCKKLFDFYFIDFCDYFGQRGLTGNLKKMVDDCKMHKTPFFFKAVVDGFMKMGKTFSNALTEVIHVVGFGTPRTSKEIIQLILNPRNDNIKPFVAVLDAMSRQENFKFTTEWITRILAIHLDKDVMELNSIIWRLIDLNRIGNDLEKIDQTLMTRFFDNVKKNPGNQDIIVENL